MSYITKTTEEKVIEQLSEIENIKKITIGFITNESKRAYDLFWFKGEHPNEKAKRLGVNVIQIFQDHAETEAFIKSKDDSHVVLGVPEQFEIAWNQDGSCVITDKILPIEN